MEQKISMTKKISRNVSSPLESNGSMEHTMFALLESITTDPELDCSILRSKGLYFVCLTSMRKLSAIN